MLFNGLDFFLRWRDIPITLVDPVGYSCLAPLTSLLTHCARAMAVVLPAHFLTHRARALAVVLTAGALADRADAVVVVLAASLFAHRAHTIVTVISPELVFIGHAEHSSLFRNRFGRRQSHTQLLKNPHYTNDRPRPAPSRQSGQILS